VNTVNRETLLDEPSPIYNFFGKMPDKLFEVTTISGRKIKATADHPFLVKLDNGCYEMKKVVDLTLTDKIIVRHTVKYIPDENTTNVIINDEDVLEHYKMELLELNLLNNKLPLYKLKIIARLVGALNTDGHLGIRNNETKYYNASFNLGEEYDAFQIADDIKTLGFDRPSISRVTTKFEDKVLDRTTMYKTWKVNKDGAFAYLLSIMGGFVGKKTNMKRSLPNWLINAEPSVKREFLSAFQGGDGSKLAYQKNGKTFKPSLGITSQTTQNDYLSDTIEYMTQIVSMFQDFSISCRLNTSKVDELKTRVYIVFEKSTENLERYSELINYTYCEEKRRKSSPVIEHLKIRAFNKNFIISLE
jgi:intein/homing endonuclease